MEENRAKTKVKIVKTGTAMVAIFAKSASLKTKFDFFGWLIFPWISTFGGAATAPSGSAHEGNLPLVDGAGENPAATVAMPAMPQE